MRQQIDFSPLDKPVTWADRRQEWHAEGGAKKVLGGAFGLVFAGIVFGVIFFSPAVIFRWLLLFFMLFAVAGYVRSVKNRLTWSVICRRFAAANGLELLLHDTARIPADGAIFGVGTNAMIAYGFSQENGWLVANYTFTTQSNESSQEHTWGILRAKLSKHVPNVILDATETNIVGSNLPKSYGSGQVLELEGDFNKYFHVLVPDGYGRDTLYFLTPELMAVLVDYGKEYEIELIDDYLYMYKEGGFKFDKANMSRLFQTIDYFAYQFEDNVKRYTDTRVPVSKLANTVAPEGSRLQLQKTRLLLPIVIAVVIFFFFMFAMFVLFLTGQG